MSQKEQFFRPDGTLIAIPVKSAMKIGVLHRIAEELSPGVRYPEKELNAIFAKYHDDTAAIRRHMIEYGILERDTQRVYWLSVISLLPGRCQCPPLHSIHDHEEAQAFHQSTDLP